MAAAAKAAERAAFPAGTEAFAYCRGQLAVEETAVADIAAEVGTPFYVYSAAALRGNYRRFAEAFGDLPMLTAYAVKANSNQAVLRLLGNEGAGADIVSGGELSRALAAGIAPGKIVYSGVGKTAAELDFALKTGIFCFNIETAAELKLLAERAQALKLIAPVSLRINPDIDAQTHVKIATGKAENKFGIPAARAEEFYRLAASAPFLAIRGVDVHIGSQIETAAPFERVFRFAARLVGQLRAGGFPIRHIDVGGGLGVAYRAGRPAPLAPEAYAALLRRHLGGLGLDFITEPGRYIAANAGALIASVAAVKQGAAKNFIICDAGMNDLIRPTLYEAHHEIIPAAEAAADVPRQMADIVGPICETGDYLALNRAMPQLGRGDLLAVLSAGAYGAVMSSVYNSRPLAAEVMVEGSRFALIRPRQTVAELIARDHMPDWL